LESSWGALSDGTIRFSPIFRGKMHFLNFQSLIKELKYFKFVTFSEKL
jgi:hypothetical protein